MSEIDTNTAAARRSKIVGRLVQQYQSAANPDKWLQAMTLEALRALDRSGLTPGVKGPAQREIHEIHREAALKAKALKHSRSLVVVTATGSGKDTLPKPVRHNPDFNPF
jgi:hypothetical protein